MGLVDEARKLAVAAEQLGGPVGNRANTKALLIEPMLSALGWETTDLKQVVRDWPVSDDESVSYALRLDGDAPAVFVEARGASENFDPGVLANQTLGRIASTGARWCVITDGFTYRVFVTASEPLPPGQQLLYEVRLDAVAAESVADVANLSLLARDSVQRGDLAQRIDQVFTDPRVREALVQLTRNPSEEFLRALATAVGTPGLGDERLRASLARLFATTLGDVSQQATPTDPPEEPDALQRANATGIRSADSLGVRPVDRDVAPAAHPAQDTPAAVDPPTARVAGPSSPERPVALAAAGAARLRGAEMPSGVAPVLSSEMKAASASMDSRETGESTHGHSRGGLFGRKTEYPLVDYLAGKPEAILELFRELDECGTALGDDMTRRVQEEYVEYLRSRKQCFALELYHHRIVMHLWLDAAAVQAWWWAQDAAREMIDIRDRGSGESEYSVSDAEQLKDARQLIQLAYEGLPRSK
ncbi:MAG TPA: DUF5655 domain-containing protein [Solirubrobacteraceae bacterium]|jgi:predicted transport protein